MLVGAVILQGVRTIESDKQNSDHAHFHEIFTHSFHPLSLLGFEISKPS